MAERGLSRRSFLRGSAVAAALAAVDVVSGGCTSSDTGPPTAPSSADDAVRLRFPTGFWWGASTSAYQIEGAAAADGKGPSVWDTFAHRPGTIADGTTGDVADDHYHRYTEDLALMSSLSLRSYRFSVSWPRVLPAGTGGRAAVNQRGLDFYKRLVDGLRERAIRPVLTLWHWDTPQALQDAGGWENRDTPQHFADYAALLYEALGDRVGLWLTINEPKTVVDVGYISGFYAPGKRDSRAGYTALHHMLLGHGLAVQALKAAGPAARVGPVLNLAPTYPDPPEDPDAARAARLRDGYENRLYLDPLLQGDYPDDVVEDLLARGVDLAAAIRGDDLAIVSTPFDVLGIDYYNPVVVDARGTEVVRYPVSQASWEQIYPQGLYDILTRVRSDYGDLTISITENGIPTTQSPGPAGVVDDPDRIAYLRDHLVALHRAIAAGVRVEGYHVWSLLDNFEWAQGYTQRWGLTHVDFESQRRTPKRSAAWYRQVITDNTVGTSAAPAAG